MYCKTTSHVAKAQVSLSVFSAKVLQFCVFYESTGVRLRYAVSYQLQVEASQLVIKPWNYVNVGHQELIKSQR